MLLTTSYLPHFERVLACFTAFAGEFFTATDSQLTAFVSGLSSVALARTQRRMRHARACGRERSGHTDGAAGRRSCTGERAMDPSMATRQLHSMHREGC